MGILNVATYVTVDGQYVNTLEMNQYQNKIRFLQLTGTSGTLTSEQINLLRSDNTNYIIVDNELYNCNDLQDTNGYLAYTHTGADTSNNVNIKTLSITLTNNNWSIQTTPVQPKIPVANTNEAVQFAEDERQKSKNLCGLIDFEQTINGVTIKLVSASQTVTLNGTATSTFDAMTTVRNMLPYVSNMQGEDLKVTAYYVSGTKSDSAIAFISTIDNNAVFDDRSAGILLPDNNLTSINFSPSKNSTYNTLMLYTPSGTSFTNYMFRIQIEKGQVTDWEYPHGPISHNKELDDVAVSNSTFSLSEANANSYQSVYDLLRVNKGVGNFYFAGPDFPSFLPPCPEDVWHGAGNIDQIVVKIDTNNFTKSLSMTLQGINQNSQAYKLDAYFDGTNWRNSGWYKPRAIELIYDMSSSDANINKGKTSGVQFSEDRNGYISCEDAPNSKYNGLNVYVYAVNQTLKVYVPVNKASTSYSCRTSFAGQNEAVNYDNILFGSIEYVYGTLYAVNIRDKSVSAINNYQNNSSYYVSKIEGVL